jgi:hypothetical protein
VTPRVIIPGDDYTLSVKVKQSHYRSGQALRVPGGWGFQISRQSAHEVKVVSNDRNPSGRIMALGSTQSLTEMSTRKYSWYSGNIPGTHFCWRLSRSQGHSATERIMTPSGIEPATFRFVAQCLNQLRHRVSPYFEGTNRYIYIYLLILYCMLLQGISCRLTLISGFRRVMSQRSADLSCRLFHIFSTSFACHVILNANGILAESAFCRQLFYAVLCI